MGNAFVTCSKCRNRIEISDMLNSDLRLLCDDLAAKVEKQRAEIERLRAERDACITFIEHEMAWCDFRGEWLSDNASVENSRKLEAFLNKQEAA